MKTAKRAFSFGCFVILEMFGASGSAVAVPARENRSKILFNSAYLYVRFYQVIPNFNKFIDLTI